MSKEGRKQASQSVTQSNKIKNKKSNLLITYFYRNMNSNKNGWDSPKWGKMPYFHCGPSTKTRKH